MITDAREIAASQLGLQVTEVYNLGTLMVPIVVSVFCVLGFILAFRMCKNYSPREVAIDLGLEKESEFLEMSKKRREELNNGKIKNDYYKKIYKYADAECMEIFELREPEPYYGRDLDIDN